jgi:xanthine dehydrogenase YagR molybdenum-binding subunit
MPDYSWPQPPERRVIGKRLDRVDGLAKSSGTAKFSSDFNQRGMLYGALLTSP